MVQQQVAPQHFGAVFRQPESDGLMRLRDLPFAQPFAKPAILGAAVLRGLGEPRGSVVVFAECGLRVALGEQAAAGVVVCAVEQDGLGLAAQQ